MIRFLIPFLAVVICAWVMLYGLRPKLRHQTWMNARHAVVAISIGFAVLAAVFIVFFFWGSIKHG